MEVAEVVLAVAMAANLMAGGVAEAAIVDVAAK